MTSCSAHNPTKLGLIWEKGDYIINSNAMASSLESYAIDLRRTFHMYPERSYQEEKTCQRICEELRDIGIPYEIIGDYNVVATIACGEGKKLAIRGDMDALPIAEALDVPWKSKIEGMMHACGHDAHIATLLATAKGLYTWKSQLSGTYYLCFQQAEEESGGAWECVDHLISLGGVDCAIALHMDAGLDVGYIDIKEGSRCSGCMDFKILVQGGGGHGARPDLSIDPIQIACEIYLRVKQIPIYHHNPFHRCLVSICSVHAGSSGNVIPTEAQMEGTIRYTQYGDGQTIFDKIQKIATDIATSYGATAMVNRESTVVQPIINDGQSIAHAQKVCDVVGLVDVPMNPAAGSDNFSAFLHAFSGCYGFIGAKSNRVDASEKHHNPYFDINESALVKTIAFYLEYVTTFSNHPKFQKE